ncbi:MAG: hypothetical protein IJ171_01580 [Ruminococcus sp.]|nr:hypothetical protein [Ruminococcus sp.]
MHKKKYVSPELEILRLTIKDAVCASPENLNTQIDGPGDWGDPVIDPDDDIVWQGVCR